MKSTTIANIANQAAEMLEDEHHLGEVTEMICCRIAEDEKEINEKDLCVNARHVLKVMFGILHKNYN